MLLRLTIENMDRLPDGGPLRVQVEGRGLDIGRDQHLDWTLPDPSRHVSSKHCEIRFRDGGYWLHDVSTNGTFVNGAQFRLEAPHLLRSGDRLAIGQYIVAVEIEGPGAPERLGTPASSAHESPADLWGAASEAAAPDDRRDYMPERVRKAAPDFLDFASGLGPAEFSQPPKFCAGRRFRRSRPFPVRKTTGCAAKSRRPLSRRLSRSRRRRAGQSPSVQRRPPPGSHRRRVDAARGRRRPPRARGSAPAWTGRRQTGQRRR